MMDKLYAKAYNFHVIRHGDISKTEEDMLINTPKTLSAYMREQRKMQGHSQQQLGEFVGLRQATVSAFENSPENISVETFFKLLAALHLDMYIEPRESYLHNRDEE